ncbi:hypothetical protein CEXT_38551 [Caerostris extrusa]|uniref:Uncharacterized protein n=1 Tax=Caerostris extrusa TaxID=172846 RepID=A0AAV4VTR2_CAEEX|nr:hypothetical protein CEXT_38551 [Caerostris extrusa]
MSNTLTEHYPKAQKYWEITWLMAWNPLIYFIIIKMRLEYLAYLNLECLRSKVLILLANLFGKIKSNAAFPGTAVDNQHEMKKSDKKRFMKVNFMAGIGVMSYFSVMAEAFLVE